jgi:U2 small nuclear ribonucleoprotein B''
LSLWNQLDFFTNLPEKISKEDIKRALYALFGQFGKIIDVVALKTKNLRGQAWVVFTSISTATNAMNNMQGYPLFDKPIGIQFAKSKSNAIIKIDGNHTTECSFKKGSTTSAQTTKGCPHHTFTSANHENSQNKMLFIENLPQDSTAEMLTKLFQQFTGFIEVRLVPSRKGIAFVDFETNAHASFAKSGLDNFKITAENALIITFAKR